ncbi:restriction endonuclease subunit S [Sulfitobacter sp. M22]|uniref:restriction endonuclease subunit S n=1 Tax=Sulfitobacter sp. M22 TaxID=2675332 RepID=UPI001EFFF04E
MILSVKGTIGTAALVPSDVPMEDDSHFWTAGQSFMILRPKKSKVSGVALLEFLSSDAVKTSLRSLAVGAAIQTIAIKDLKEFQVPVPSDEEKAAIEAAFQKRQDKRAQVRLLLEDIDRERDASWPHDALQGWQG